MNQIPAILLTLANPALRHTPRIREIFEKVLIPIASLIAPDAQNRKGCLVTCFMSGPGNNLEHDRGDILTIQFGKVLPTNGMFALEKIARCADEDSLASSKSMHDPLTSYASIPFHALKGFQFAGCVRTTETDGSHNYISVSGFNPLADELIAAVLQFVFFGTCVNTDALTPTTRAKLEEALKIAEAKTICLLL